MATHTSRSGIFLAWKIPWIEEPGGLQSMGSQRAGYDWAIEYTCRQYHVEPTKFKTPAPPAQGTELTQGGHRKHMSVQWRNCFLWIRARSYSSCVHTWSPPALAIWQQQRWPWVGQGGLCRIPCAVDEWARPSAGYVPWQADSSRQLCAQRGSGTPETW